MEEQVEQRAARPPDEPLAVAATPAATTFLVAEEASIRSGAADVATVSGAATPPAALRLTPAGVLGGLVASPGPTMARLAAARPWGAALGFYVLTALVGGLVGLVGEPLSGPQLAPVAVGALLTTPVILFLTTAIIYLGGGFLGGQGHFGSLFTTLGFASLPFLLQAPLAALFGLGGASFGPLNAGLWLLALLWTLGLDVLAIRESLHLPTERAVAALLLPFGLALALACLLAIIVATAIIAFFSHIVGW